MSAPSVDIHKSRWYVFGPSEPVGVILGQSWPQLWLLAGDAGLVLAFLSLSHGWTYHLVVLAGLIVSLLYAYAPVGNSTLIGWTGIWVGLQTQHLIKQDDYLGGQFRMNNTQIEAPDARLPGVLGNIRFIQFTAGPGTAPLAIAHDARDRTYVAVIRVEGDTFHLLEAADQNVRQAAYSRMLGALCRPGSLITRLQVFERTVPDTADALTRDFRTRAPQAVTLLDQHDATAPDAGDVEDGPLSGALLAAESYRQLTDAAGPAGRRHEVYVAIAVSGAKAARAIRDSGGGDAGAAAVVAREVNSIRSNLVAAGVSVKGWAGPRLLAYIVRTAFDPDSTAVVDRRGGGVDDIDGGEGGLPSGVDLRQAAPHRAQNRWGSYRTDSAFHRAYWVAEWPRSEAPAAFLNPLLMFAGGRRTISLVYEPRDARVAKRQVERKIDKIEGEAGLRSWLRLRRSKRANRNIEHLNRREDELLQGESLLALRAYVTISAKSMDELTSLEADIMAMAAQASIELQPMYGTHDQGFAVGALPLARSL